MRRVERRLSFLGNVSTLEDWTARAITIKRTTKGERVATALDCLARSAMGGGDFTAA
jgi:hypothetical protein